MQTFTTRVLRMSDVKSSSTFKELDTLNVGLDSFTSSQERVSELNWTRKVLDPTGMRTRLHIQNNG